MRQERSYVQPSCVLQVWWEEELVLNDRLVPQKLGFRLRFSDNQVLAGDLARLADLIQVIDIYLQNFLKGTDLPEYHHLLGLKLSSAQLVDVSDAIEALRAEILLLPAVVQGRQPWETLKTAAVAIASLTIGAVAGMWLASRSPRLAPSSPVVVAPAPTAEVAPSPPIVVREGPSPSPQPQTQPSTKKLPPIRVYPRPPAPPPAEKVESPLEPSSVNRGLSEPAPETTAMPPIAIMHDTASPPPPSLTVEIATSEILSDSLLTYLRSQSPPPGQVTIDVTIEAGKVAAVAVEGGDSTPWTELLKNWTPPEEMGRVRLKISVP